MAWYHSQHHGMVPCTSLFTLYGKIGPLTLWHMVPLSTLWHDTAVNTIRCMLMLWYGTIINTMS